MNITTTTAADISRHHDLARSKATEAIAHAMEAGKLLLQAKDSLAHGTWGAWLQSNVTVTPRQAQRYMALAQGKPSPLRVIAKNDTVSHLLASQAAAPVQTWAPTPGHWMHATTDEAAWWVVPSLEHPGFFHVSKIHSLSTPEPTDQVEGWDGASIFDGTKRPVRADVVELFLQHLGMAEPWNAEWRAREKPGLSRPFGEPEGRDLPVGRAT
ncbi:MAG: DUF3102 domain-containing protein [Rhodoferax sp.]|nr:DUF3102 domain-containing protein [Rhodoferax sp.]